MNQNFINSTKRINRVVFAGDPIRGEQAVNIEKTHALFAPVLLQLGVSMSSFITDINRNTNREEWVPVWKDSLSNYRDPKLSFIDASNTAVIGFEIPDVELDCLNAKGVRWINLSIHPLRFLDDLHFELNTSFSFDQSTISTSQGFIHSCAGQIIQRHSESTNQNKKNALLICGQDWIDRSIHFDGEFRNLSDYLSKLDDLVGCHERVIYKPHPAFSSIEVFQIISNRFNIETCTTTDLYKIFATGNIKTVTAISSSVLTEAPFFGIDAVFLEPRAKRYGLPVSYRELVDSADFWASAFLEIEDNVRSLKISASVPANYIRKTFGSWSFITEEMNLERRLGMMEMKAEQAEAKVEQAYEQQLQLQLKLEHQAEQAQTRGRLVQQQLENAQTQLGQVTLLAQAAQTHAQQLQLQLVQQAEQTQTQGRLVQQQLESIQSQLSQARSVSEGLLKENQELKISLSTTEEELHNVHKANHHHWLLATQLQQHNTALLHSWSWRLTAPARAAINLTLHPVQTSKQLANKAVAWGLNTFSKPLGHGMAWVLARPQLAERINRKLLGWPHLHGHMLTIARKQGVVQSPAINILKNSEEHKTALSGHTTKPHVFKLSPRAKQIYSDLQSAIKRHQSGSN